MSNTVVPIRPDMEHMKNERSDATIWTMLWLSNVDFKDNVETVADLPIVWNSTDDFRLVKENWFVYKWNGSAWIKLSAGSINTPAQLLTKPKIGADLWATQRNFLDILSYISNGKAYADVPAVAPLPQLTIDGAGFLRWYTLMGKNNNGVTETFWVTWPEADISGMPSFSIDLGDMIESWAFPIKSIGYVNFSGSDLTVWVDLFNPRNDADIFEFDYVTSDSEQGGNGQIEWDWNDLVMNWNYIYTMGGGYNFIISGTTVDITTLSGSIIPDWESIDLWVFTDNNDLRLRPLYSSAWKLLAIVQLSNSTGSDWTFWVDALSLLSVSVTPLTPWAWGWPTPTTPYNYIINRANFMFIPEVWELHQTEIGKIYVDWDIEESQFVASVPSFSLNNWDFLYLLGKYDGNRSRETSLNNIWWDFLNDGLPIVLIKFRNNWLPAWTYGTQASSWIEVEITPFYWNSNTGYSQLNNEVAEWYRLAEWNTSTNTQLSGTPVRLVRDWLLNRAKFLTSNTWMSPNTFGGDMMTPFDWDATFFAQSQSTGSGTATYNLVSVDKTTGQFVFYSWSAFTTIEQVLRQIPLGWDKMAFGWLDGSGDWYVVIGTTDYSTGISLGSVVASGVNGLNQIAVKLNTDRFAIIWENWTDVVCASYDVTGTTFTIDAWPQVITSMTPTEIATLCKWANFSGSIVQVAIDKFVMCPASTTNSYVVDTSSGITSGQNWLVTSWVYNSVIRLDLISRLVWVTNDGSETSWYIVWVSWNSLTYSWETWVLTFNTIQYKIANNNGDAVSMVWIVDNWDDSWFKTIRGTFSVSNFTITGSVTIGQTFGVLQSNFLKVRNLHYLETDSVSEWFIFWGTQSSNPAQWLMMVFHSQANSNYEYTSLDEYYETASKFRDYVWVIRNAVTVYSAGVPITYVQVNALGSMLKLKWYSVSDTWSPVYINTDGRSLTQLDNNFVAGIQYSTDSSQNIYLTKDLDNEVSRYVDTDTFLDTGTDTLTIPYRASEADTLIIGDVASPWTFDIEVINGLIAWDTYQIVPASNCTLSLIITAVGSAGAGDIIYSAAWPIVISANNGDSAYIRVAGNGMIELIGVNSFI